MSFSGYLRQNTAATRMLGPFVSSTDGNTVLSTLTIAQADVRLSKNGANIAQKGSTATLTHDELGIYPIVFTSADTNTLGELMVAVHESPALIVKQTYSIVDPETYDGLFGGGGPNLFADHILRRQSSLARASTEGDTITFRSLLGAISKLTNKIDTTTSSGKLTIFQEDDTTSFATQSITTSTAANPITAADTD